MKKLFTSLFVTSLLLVAVVAFADKNLPVYKKGDTVYVCTCGDTCDCKTMARKAGKCDCGTALGKGTVSSASKDKIVVTVGDKKLNFPAKAKYACGCGDGCDCGSVSQKPGKCTCGNEMKKIN
ncbi:MAG: hypothetical protein ACOYL3_14880 [Desulfuromonadaceae bacterium]